MHKKGRKTMVSTNRNYKDSLFTDYFKDKARLIEAYNAISGADYPDDAEIEFNTLENVLTGTQFNDISFTIGGKFVVLIEHQSTLNKNMPLRLLMYCSRVYERIVDRKTLYKKDVQPIPAPQFYVIYNGREKCPDTVTLKLSDAFAVQGENPALELTVPVYNITEGHNGELLKKSKHLSDYAVFVDFVNRGIADGLALPEAIKNTVQYCVRHDIMVPYLESNGSEVMNMLITEFNVDEYYEVGREEGFNRGQKEGFGRGQAEVARKMKTAVKDAAEIESFTDLSLEDIEKL
jgi:hypothetical protein